MDSRGLRVWTEKVEECGLQRWEGSKTRSQIQLFPLPGATSYHFFAVPFHQLQFRLGRVDFEIAKGTHQRDGLLAPKKGNKV